MAKTQGFKIRIDAFLPIDKKDFAKQADAFKMIADIQSTKTLPADFLDKVTITEVTARQGGQEDAAAEPAVTKTPKPNPGGSSD